jgi:hypothetical protein
MPVNFLVKNTGSAILLFEEMHKSGRHLIGEAQDCFRLDVLLV